MIGPTDLQKIQVSLQSDNTNGTLYLDTRVYDIKKGKVIPLQARCGPEGG